MEIEEEQGLEAASLYRCPAPQIRCPSRQGGLRGAERGHRPREEGGGNFRRRCLAGA